MNPCPASLPQSPGRQEQPGNHKGCPYVGGGAARDGPESIPAGRFVVEGLDSRQTMEDDAGMSPPAATDGIFVPAAKIGLAHDVRIL